MGESFWSRLDEEERQATDRVSDLLLLAPSPDAVENLRREGEHRRGEARVERAQVIVHLDGRSGRVWRSRARKR